MMLPINAIQTKLTSIIYSQNIKSSPLIEAPGLIGGLFLFSKKLHRIV